jgi:hypothetical protein
MGKGIGAYRVLVGKPEEKDHLNTLVYTKDNIQMDLQDMGHGLD